jgi:hypothetical protein
MAIQLTLPVLRTSLPNALGEGTALAGGGSNSANQPKNYIPNLTEPDLLNFNLV